ncbi:MAG: O-antigen ligase family protein [Bosea sp. (in: a-proteobacteria)]
MRRENHDRADLLMASAQTTAAAALALMPLAMWLASRSAPLFLTIAALACLMMLAREAALGGEPARLNHLWRNMESPARHALLALGGFLVVALVSISWSHEGLASLRSYGELIVSLGAGALVAVVLPSRAPRWCGLALLAALVITAALTMLELSGFNVWREGVGLRAQTFIFNRTLILAVILAIPLCAWLFATKRHALACLSLATVAAAMLMSESGAGRLGLIAAIAAAAAIWLAPRLSMLFGAAGLVAIMALAPVQGEIAERAIPAKAHKQLQDSHSRDRVDIWLAFGETIRARPWAGSGFGSSPTLDRNPVSQVLPAERRYWLAVGHPHSAQVQIWAETGVIGAALLLAAMLNLLVVIGRMQGAWRIAAFGAFAGALAIAAVGHGAWQGWWIATVAACIAWFRIFMAQAGHEVLQTLHNQAMRKKDTAP